MMDTVVVAGLLGSPIVFAGIAFSFRRNVTGLIFIGIFTWIAISIIVKGIVA